MQIPRGRQRYNRHSGRSYRR